MSATCELPSRHDAAYSNTLPTRDQSRWALSCEVTRSACASLTEFAGFSNRSTTPVRFDEQTAYYGRVAQTGSIARYHRRSTSKPMRAAVQRPSAILTARATSSGSSVCTLWPLRSARIKTPRLDKRTKSAPCASRSARS